MFRIPRSRLALSITAAAAAGTLATVGISAMALAHGPAHDDAHGDTHTLPAAAATTGDATFLVGVLVGRNEVPVAGGPAVGDPDGQAVEVIRIKGNQVSFAVKWKGIGAPTASHIHAGATGSNGAVQVPFFGSALPDTLDAATGTVTVTDQALLDKLKSDPGGFYANLHTAEFPGGAVRGQLHAVSHAVDLNAFLRGGPLAAVLDGTQEVPAAGGPAVGDQDGHATSFVRPNGDKVEFSFTWNGIGAPTNGHLHAGAVGANGAVAVPLFAAPAGLPASVSGIAGTVPVKGDLSRQIRRHPADFYANLHTAEFPGGAVRGQLFASGGGDDDVFDQGSFVASVVDGVQIYQCTKQADGTFAFTQHDVRAKLQGNIRHSFVKADAGPPQWVAPDRSAVTGKVLVKTPNGTGNIAELELEATQSGDGSGILADVTEILRLNTQGGVAPAGTCDPKHQSIAEVPYKADYLFLTK